jgi:hypothetical protein
VQTVCVFEANDHAEALAIKALLESNDIICIMPNEHITGMIPFYNYATGGFKLFVSEKQYFDATTLLQAHSVIETAQKPAADDILTKSCLFCGSKNLKLETKARTGLILSIFIFFGIPIPAKKKVWVCQDCGRKHKTKPSSD